ncbi:hypothetical protein HK102_007212 [Quaeritorhiza haematococci]|nr:hypothetical protein HK102_007212 [Quaeritorhiza haematococci]
MIVPKIPQFSHLVDSNPGTVPAVNPFAAPSFMVPAVKMISNGGLSGGVVGRSQLQAQSPSPSRSQEDQQRASDSSQQQQQDSSTSAATSSSSSSSSSSPLSSLSVTEEFSRHHQTTNTLPKSTTGERGGTFPVESGVVRFGELCEFRDLPVEIRVKVFGFLDIPTLVRAAQVCKSWKNLAFDGALWTVIDFTTPDHLSHFYHSITSNQLEMLAVYAGGFLKVANFRGCLQLTSQVLRSFAENCPNISVLNLSGCRSASPASISYFIDVASKGATSTHTTSSISSTLSHLDVSGLPTINNYTLELLRVHCSSSLEYLNISHCRNVSAVGIRLLVNGGPVTGKTCSRVRVLKVAGCAGVDDGSISEIARGCPYLETLSVAYCTMVGDRGLEALANGVCRGTLKNLNLTGCANVTDEGLEFLAGGGSNSNGAGIIMTDTAKAGPGCPNLKFLQLSGLRHLTDTGLSRLITGCPHITHLDLEECTHLTNTTLQNISASPYLRLHLQHLSLSYCDHLTDDAVLQLIRSCPRLRHLEVDNCNEITDDILRELGRDLPARLEMLELFDCRGISGTAIQELLGKSRERYERAVNVRDAAAATLLAYYKTEYSVVGEKAPEVVDVGQTADADSANGQRF